MSRDCALASKPSMRIFTSEPSAMSSCTIGKGMWPQPNPARRNARFAARSVRRQVNGEKHTEGSPFRKRRSVGEHELDMLRELVYGYGAACGGKHMVGRDDGDHRNFEQRLAVNVIGDGGK